MKFSKNKLRHLIREVINEIDPDSLSREDTLAGEPESEYDNEIPGTSITSMEIERKLRADGVDPQDHWQIVSYLEAQGLENYWAEYFAGAIASAARLERSDWKDKDYDKYPDAR